MRQYINWKTSLAVIALCIVIASLYYTNRLAARLAIEERKKIEQVAEAIKTVARSKDQDIAFPSNIITEDSTIPFILTDANGSILSFNNIDTFHAVNGRKLLAEKLSDFTEIHPPIISVYGNGVSYVYYGESYLLIQLRYFPYVQLAIIFLFLIVVLIALSSAHRSLQNQVWVGLSKETAHQLGTPLSSIEAWLELLNEHEVNADAVTEMRKDLDRLKLVADRFGKVGSTPKLEEENLITRLENMVAYMQRRAPIKVKISLHTNEADVPVNISGPLFDWVMENLIRNALDAIAGTGNIDITVADHAHQVWVDIQDTGKGIAKYQVKKVFTPGFTTKKRGWGLGLSLSKRIIEKYHHGLLTVKQSEVGKGTTFRIVLKR